MHKFQDFHDHATVYLRILPELSFQRVKERNQTGDENISLELLNHLHEKHEKFISKLTNENIAVIEISNEKTLSEIVFELYIKISPTITRFIENT